MDGPGLPLASVPIPKSFCRPITAEIMVDPVATVDGHTYERLAIQTWLRSSRTSPMTNLPLPSLALTSENALKRAIEEYLSLRPELALPKLEQLSFQEAAEALQADLLAKGAEAAGAQAGIQQELMQMSAALLQLRGKAMPEMQSLAMQIGFELQKLAGKLAGSLASLSPCVGRSASMGVLLHPSSLSSTIAVPPSPSRCEITLEGFTDACCLTVLRNGQLASGSLETIKIWDVTTGRCENTLEGHTNSVWWLASLSNGQLASGSLDKTIKIWDVTTGRCENTLEVHTQEVYCLTLLRNGQLASGSDDKTIKIWDVTTGRCENTLEGHTQEVCCLALLRNGQLASGSNDNTIKIWDVTTGRCENTLVGHTDGLWCLTLLSNGQLASLCDNGTLKVWR